MKNIKLTEEEKREIIEQANSIADELDAIRMELVGLEDQITAFSVFEKNTELYEKFSNEIKIRHNRIAILEEKFQAYKEILGIKKKKKRLFKNKTL
jgi:P2-related tail formation protein